MSEKREPKFENSPVSDTDELADTGDAEKDQLRKFGEYKPTNTPLSEIERNKRGDHWIPRTTHNIGDLEPVEEKEPAKK